MRDDTQVVELRRHFKEFKQTLKALVEGNFETGLYTLKVSLLCHALDDLDSFG